MSYLNDPDKAKLSRERQERDFAQKRQRVEAAETRRFSSGVSGKPQKKKKKAIRPKKEQYIFDPNKTYPYKPGMRQEFYSTSEWRKLRWKVLKALGAKCCVCGSTKETTGRPLHVDHIKPRARYPHLELVQSNLQVLCEACNLGKGAS